MRGIFLGILFLVPLATVSAAEPMVWPTPHPAPSAGDDWTAWVQATVSGEPSSGLFGCVRSDGRQFHEAIDIAPVGKRVRGEATDPVSAAFAGVVVHTSAVVGNSAYGRYVVVEHPQFSPTLVTLYAHLASIDRATRPGQRVRAGQRLGILGRSAGGYRIPPERAHLHFEIALRLTDAFETWYERQRYGTPNEHGVYNGLNLTGMDPWDAWRWLRAAPGRDLSGYFATLRPGYIIELDTPRIPDLVRRNPALLSAALPASGVLGWRISFTAWGLPIRFEPRTDPSTTPQNGLARVVAIDADELATFECREMVKRANGFAELDQRGLRVLELLFGFE